MFTSPSILAIETATDACSVALLHNNEKKSHFEMSPRTHTEKILPMIEEILKTKNVSLQALDAIAFSRGPGSFTGVRIGVSIAQGLGFGANLPLIPLSTLLVLAQTCWEKSGATRVLTAIDARMGECYWAEYQRDNDGNWHGEETENVITPENILLRLQELKGEWTTTGDGWVHLSNLPSLPNAKIQIGEILTPSADAMLPLSLNAMKRNESLPPELAQPVYLRNEISWKKLPGR